LKLNFYHLVSSTDGKPLENNDAQNDENQPLMQENEAKLDENNNNM